MDPARYFAKRIRERYKSVVKLFQKMLMVFYLSMKYLTNNRLIILKTGLGNQKSQIVNFKKKVVGNKIDLPEARREVPKEKLIKYINEKKYS